MFGRKPFFDGVSPGDLLTTMLLSAAAFGAWGPSWLSGELGQRSLDLLAWFALTAPALGCVGARLKLRFWPLGLVPPALWMALFTAVDGQSLHGVPTPFYAALTWSGLFALGWGVGSNWVALGWGSVTLCLLTSLLLAAGPSLVTVLGDPVPQWLVVRALDLSPLTWVMESAGLDWMRHPCVYDLAGSLPPEVRTPFEGMLAGPLVFLVGWGFVLVGELRSRKHSSAEPTTPSTGKP